MSETPPDKNTLLFTQLVLTLQAAAMQQLGKIPDPAGGTVSREITQARLTIDTLDMLQAKCKGNLSNDEERLMTHVISELKLNFVDELNRKRDSEQEENTNNQ